MCGIVGVAGDLSFKDENPMKRLLMVDYFRGPDSTGLAGIRQKGGAHKIAKIGSNPIDLFGMSQFKDTLSGAACQAFIGHNRAATRGGVSTGNAHPFQYGDIIGVHNGTLTYATTLRLEEALEEKFSVDSQALIAAIDKLGITETVGLLDEGATYVDGAWAIVWYDGKDNTLNFLRNKHRPLWYAYEADFKRILFASEWEMLKAVNDLSNKPYKFNYKKEKNENYCFFQFPADVHYKYDLEKLQKGDKEPKPIVKTLKGREPSQAAHAGYDDPFGRQTEYDHNLTGFHRPGTSGTHTTTVGRTPSTKTTTPPGTKKIVHLVGDRTLPFAGIIGKQQFDGMTSWGCSFCKTPLEWEDKGMTVYESDETVLCRECSGHHPEETAPPTKIYATSSVFDFYART